MLGLKDDENIIQGLKKKPKPDKPKGFCKMCTGPVHVIMFLKVRAFL